MWSPLMGLVADLRGRLRRGRNSMTLEDNLQWAARLILAARRFVALTGAGISTPSGIPDYRSPGSGLWEIVDPNVASLSAFRADPAAFYEAMRPLAEKVLLAEPNAAHRALAELERQGFLSCVITQNIDGLHQKAGSRCVWEVHGHLRQATCTRCGRIAPVDGLLWNYVMAKEIPRCPSCGAVLKPNAVLFGEPLPRGIFLEAAGEAERCDLMLVAGASLEVAPASELPLLALRNGANIIVANELPTPIDAKATVVLRGDLAETLPQLVTVINSMSKIADKARKG